MIFKKQINIFFKSIKIEKRLKIIYSKIRNIDI